MRSTITAIAIGIGAAAGACGSSSSTPAVDARPADARPADAAASVSDARPTDAPPAPPPDAATADAAPPLGVGAACPIGDECAPGLYCLDDTINPALPPNGYCTKVCTADDQCGGDSFCSPNPIGPPGSPRLCFQSCPGDASACAGAPERVCATTFGGLFELERLACVPGDSTKTDGDPCAGHIGSCNANQTCVSNPFDAPGGMCMTLGCTPGDDSTCAPGGDGLCVSTPTGSACLDRCASQAECRVAEGYECGSLPGVPTSICVFVHAEPGAACVIDADCGPSPWQCQTGPAFPAGYCTGDIGTCSSVDPDSCPIGAACFDPDLMVAGDQYCVKLCAGDDDCRAADNYSCQDILMGRTGCVAN